MEGEGRRGYKRQFCAGVWGGVQGESVGPGSSDSTAGEVERGILPIVIMPYMYLMKPICDMSTLHTPKREQQPQKRLNHLIYILQGCGP